MPEHFIGRQKELHELVGMVNKGRFVTVKGAPGIGKTAVAKALARYLVMRRRFNGGIHFITLRGAQVW